MTPSTEPGFPHDVLQVLSAAGWHSDRDVSAEVSAWLRELYATAPEIADRLPIFPAAREVLDEFGGLTFRQLKRPGVATGGFDVRARLRPVAAGSHAVSGSGEGGAWPS